MTSTERSDVKGNTKASADIRRIQRFAASVGLVGLVLVVLGATVDQEQFWRSYLLAYVFWLEIALGCLGMVMLHHLVGGRWSAHVLRLMETGAMTLPLLALLFVPLVFGLPTLYPWTDLQYVQASEAMQQKTLYLNTPFFIGRAVVYFAIWVSLAYLLNRWSLEQDRTGEPQLATRMVRLSAGGMILFVVTGTFAAYDWMMSLEPEWFSSIYGLMFISGQALAALALAIVGLRTLSRNADRREDWTQSFNDLGNFLLGFVMIWIYFSFSQFLIIWTANIPEEAIWYIHRNQGGWQYVAVLLLVFHFALPFVLLLSRRVKRTVYWLTALAALIFFVRLVDLYWLIMPAFYPKGIHFDWFQPALWITLGGWWILLFSWQWRNKSSLPRHDRRLSSVGGHRARHEELASGETGS